MSSMKAEKPEGPGTTLVVLMAKAPAGFTRFASRRNASPPSIGASSAWDPSNMNTSSSPSMATSKPLQNRPYAVFRTSLEKVSGKGARELLEIVEGRLRTGSLLICSQFSPAGWHAKLGEGAIADAVIDRIVYRSDIIHIEGDESMRKRIG